MSKILFCVAGIVVAVLAVAAAATAIGTPRATALTNCTTETAGLDAGELQLLSLINDFRAENGRAPLKASPSLSRSAAWLSEDLVFHGAFDHFDSLGRSPFTRVKDCGYPSSGAGENLALTGGGAQSAFQLWKTSTAGHRENMLNPAWVVAGIGHTGAIWAADFGNVDDSAASTQPPTPPPPAAPTSTPTSLPTLVPTPTTMPLPPIAGVTLGLSAGENLVVYTGSEQPAMVALRSIANTVVVVYEWEAAEQRWTRFSPGKPGYVNTFTTLKPGGIYSVEMSTDGIWAY
jgi:uncharacterized protein YkwD